MRKYLSCLLLFEVFIFFSFGEYWEKSTWNSDSRKVGAGYIHYQTCTDETGAKSQCSFYFLENSECKDVLQGLLFGIMASYTEKSSSESSMLQTYNSTLLKMKNEQGNIMDTFKVTIEKKEGLIQLNCFDKSAYQIYALLNNGGVWEFSFAIKDKTFKVVVNCEKIPLRLDMNNIFITSSNGKILQGVKPWARQIIDNIDIPEGVTEIAVDAFNSCYELISVNMPKSVEKIGGRAFAYCRNLKDINSIDFNPKDIEQLAFNECSSLEVPEFLKNAKVAGKDKKYGTIDYNAFTGCKAFKNEDFLNSDFRIKDDYLYFGESICSILNLEKEKYVLPGTAIMYNFSEVLYRCKNVKEIVISKPTKIEVIDFDDEELVNCPFIKNITCITCPKSVKLRNLPTTVRVIRN